jgi:hypothetical protein
MTKQTLSIFAACIATFSSIDMPIASAAQQCSAAVPSNQLGHWSWRMIDGRKCWYEGKPLLSKSLLEWPAPASAQLRSNAEVERVIAQEPDPFDSQARSPSDSNTFEARWRTTVEGH